MPDGDSTVEDVEGPTADGSGPPEASTDESPQEKAPETVTDAENAARAADSDPDLPPEVRSAIAENPESVARFLENLEAANTLLDGASVATAAMDDEMVRTLAETGTNLGAAADGLATPEAAALGAATGENAEDLAEAIEQLAALQRSGTLEDVLELADVLSLATAAMDDEMVRTLAATGSRLGEVADTAADEDVAGSLESVLVAVGEAGAGDPSQPGLVGLLRATRDPDVRAGLGFMLSVAGALGSELRAE